MPSIDPDASNSGMPGGAAVVSVERTDARDIPMRALKVYLDGVYWMDLAHGKPAEREVSPGAHTLRITNTLFSRQTEFEAQSGETVRFVAGNREPAWWTFILVIIGAIPYRVFLDRLES